MDPAAGRRVVTHCQEHLDIPATSVVVKDWLLDDKDKDKDLGSEDEDEDKDLRSEDKDEDKDSNFKCWSTC